MNWDALGAVAETLGAIGVIATLAYLATQIRHNTNELKGEAIRDINNIENELCKEVREDPELYATVIRGMLAWASQPPRDQARAHMYFYSYTRWFETCWTLWRRGALDEKALRSRENFIFAILSNPDGGRNWWRQWKTLYDPDFVAYVDDRAEQLGEDFPNLAEASFYNPEHWQ